MIAELDLDGLDEESIEEVAHELIDLGASLDDLVEMMDRGLPIHRLRRYVAEQDFDRRIDRFGRGPRGALNFEE